MIIISKLSYRYTDTFEISFPDFAVARNETFLLLGESGSGKTTLLYLVAGLLRNYSGSIQIKDTKLEKLSEPKLDKFRGKNMGFVFQRNHLISALTVEQNLLMPPYLSGLPIDYGRIEEVLKYLGIFSLRKSKITHLSQGQAQRVAIARAIIIKPAIILADEPTSALDDKNCSIVMSLLTDVAKESHAALIIATHDQRLKDRVQKKIVLT